MADIVLTGDTSGSITVAAPAVAGTNTLTLPANTGNIVTTGDSNTITQGMIASNVAGTGPAFSANIGSAQTVTAATWTKANFNTEEFDTNSCYNNSTYDFTPTVSGYYQVNIHMTFNGTSPAGVGIALYKNGSIHKYLSLITPSFGSGGILQNSCLIYLNGTTDYISAYGYCNASGTVQFSGGTTQSSFQAFLARAA